MARKCFSYSSYASIQLPLDLPDERDAVHTTSRGRHCPAERRCREDTHVAPQYGLFGTLQTAVLGAPVCWTRTTVLHPATKPPATENTHFNPFYLSHCSLNTFTLTFSTQTTWKIQHAPHCNPFYHRYEVICSHKTLLIFSAQAMR